ncbi:MAG: aminotransferase class V-fold PLP-dependent enzyme [Opitutales bacterium]|nr:aminotransferase class V-fold PLP-dependent enzyme [Opitutales bacterium]
MFRKLFTIGPVQMYPNTATIRAKGFPHFRTDEFSKVVLSNTEKLKSLLGCGASYSLIYLASSGTGAMEATVENCFDISSPEKALVINGGGFGKRFCELLQYHGIPFDSIDLKWNEPLSAEHLAKVSDGKYCAMLVNMHETTTGQLYPMKMLSDFCKNREMLFIVDAISSFLADPFSMEELGIDLAIISSQKGLCLSPGMAMVAMSGRMKDRVMAHGRVPSFYFDFKDYLVNIPRGQTPYTPPVCVMFELEDMLDMIEKRGGLQPRLEEVKTRCTYFREKSSALGYKTPDIPLSNMLTPLYFEDINAYDVIQTLKNDFGYYVNPCGGELATKLFRVSHIGNTTLADIDDLLAKLQICVKRARNI